MIAQDFPETGWQVVPGAAPSKRFRVFGERSSGTNFVKRLIGRNTGLSPIEELGWNHGFPHMTAMPEDVAVICIVRETRDWALSTHAKPCHCPPHMQALAFSDCPRRMGHHCGPSAVFPADRGPWRSGPPFQHDRHPVTGASFANLFVLPRAKIDGLFSFFARKSALIFAQLESVRAAPDRSLSDASAALGLPAPAEPLRPVIKRLGSRVKPAVAVRKPIPRAPFEADPDLLRQELDPAQEARHGYRD